MLVLDLVASSSGTLVPAGSARHKLESLLGCACSKQPGWRELLGALLGCTVAAAAQRVLIQGGSKV